MWFVRVRRLGISCLGVETPIGIATDVLQSRYTGKTPTQVSYTHLTCVEQTAQQFLFKFLDSSNMLILLLFGRKIPQKRT